MLAEQLVHERDRKAEAVFPGLESSSQSHAPISIAGWFGASLVLMAILYGGIHPLRTDYWTPLKSTASLGLWGALLIAFALWRRGARALTVTHAPEGFALGLSILMLSDIPSRGPSLLYALVLPGTLTFIWVPLLCILCGTFVWAALGARSLRCLAIAGLLVAAWRFDYGTAGQLIFTDDHPAFLYRLIQLRENFPFIPFYNPSWNGGVEAREFLPSGVINVFLLFAPLLLAARDISGVYNVVVLGVMAILPAASMLLAARALRLSGVALWASVLFALSPSYLTFRWGISYGTLGFLTSAALYPLSVALAVRMVRHGPGIGFGTMAGIAATWTLMALWSPSCIVFLPLALVALVVGARTIPRRVYAFGIILLLTVNLPWMMLFVESSRVTQFVTQEKSPESTTPSGSARTVKRITTGAVQTAVRKEVLAVAPWLVMLALPGLLRERRSRVRILLALAITWPLLFGTVAGRWFPQMEFERFWLFSALLLSIPAGICVEALVRARPRSGPFVTGLGLLVLAVLHRFHGNQSFERYSVAGEEVPRLVDAINRFGGTGRVLFTGFTLHDVARGHVAPLAAWTDKPLIAASYQHDLWKYTDVVPKVFHDRGDAGMEEFFELYNISAVLAKERVWKAWLGARPESYRRAWSNGKYDLFERTGKRSYVMEGEAIIVDQRGSAITVVPTTERVVLRFRHLPILESSGCVMKPLEVYPGTNFIELTQCSPGQTVRIASIPPWKR